MDTTTMRYPMPMLTCPELEIVVRKRTSDEYALDEFNGRTPASSQRVVRR